MKPMAAVAAFRLVLGMMASASAQIITTTDTFGSGASTFTLDFVTVGNASNVADSTGYGSVPYTYRISTYEISQNDITTATAAGMTNVTASGTAVYNPQSNPADVSLSGGLSPYGTMGQNGNAWEWSESAIDGSNDVSDESRAIRGGYWFNTEFFLRSSSRRSDDPLLEDFDTDFRIASVPEPSTVLLVLMTSGAWLIRRRWSRSL